MGTSDIGLTGIHHHLNYFQDPPEQVIKDCNREVDETIRRVDSPFRMFQPSYKSKRVLRKGGSFIYLTFGQPHFRQRYLTRPETTLEVKSLGDAFHYYLYIVRKV